MKIGREQEDEAEQDCRHGGSFADIEAHESGPVDEVADEIGSDARSAARHDVDEVVSFDREDQPDQQRYDDHRPHERQRDVPERLKRTSAVDPRRLVRLAWQSRQACQQQHDHEGNLVPDIDEDDCPDGDLGAAQPVDRLQSRNTQQIVDDAESWMKEHSPDQPDDDRIHEQWTQQNSVIDGLESLHTVQHQRDQEADGELNENHGQDEEGGEPHAVPKLGIRERDSEIGEPCEIVEIGRKQRIIVNAREQRPQHGKQDDEKQSGETRRGHEPAEAAVSRFNHHWLAHGSVPMLLDLAVLLGEFKHLLVDRG